jgi:protein-L-isoaspartate O-methyltransferase
MKLNEPPSNDEGRPVGLFEGTEMPTAGWWEALWPDPAGVLDKLGLKAGMAAVDLCCGDGWFTLHVAKVARRVIAIDVDRKFLDIACAYLGKNGVTNCSFVYGDAYDIASLAPPADFVFLANVFHGVPDKPRLAGAIRQALRPGGRLAIVNWHQRPREDTKIMGEARGPKIELRMSPDQTIQAVEAGELTFTRLVELPPYHYGVVFERPTF